MNRKFFNSVKKQAHHTMAILGCSVSIVYVMRELGFNNPYPIPYEFRGAWLFGIFLGLLINDYYYDDKYVSLSEIEENHEL